MTEQEMHKIISVVYGWTTLICGARIQQAIDSGHTMHST